MEGSEPGGLPDVDDAALRRWHAGLESLLSRHVEVAQEFLKGPGSGLRAIDMFLLAAVQRSHDIAAAVLMLCDARNLAAAAPLVRLQIDTLVRVSYMARSGDSDGVAHAVIAGVEFRKMKDADGEFLSDTRLLALARPHHGWVEPVYRRTSGWVHLSPDHLTAAFGAWGDSEGVFLTRVPFDPEIVPLRIWAELLGATAQATREILAYAQAWGAQKEDAP